MSKPFRGYFAIAMTPFNEQGDVLWDDLQRECDWTVRAGAHGLVWPVNDSEYTVLSFPERVQGMSLVVQAIAGRIPVMVGVADTSTAGAVALAREAHRTGADAVIAMPPWHVKLASPALVEAYYRAVAEAAALPVCIQNLGGTVGSNLSSQFCIELCKKIPYVNYVKEERDPHGDCVSEIIALAGPEVKGVFTGGTLLGLISAFRRGAAGNMAASYTPDLDAQIWDLLEAGDEHGARRIQDAWAVLEKAVQATPGLMGRKEILVRRGVFSCNAKRNLGRQLLDKEYLAELEHGLSVVAPYFRL
jgi:dihydrodipicolinate synthase/N-acetylneuraminate lyase